MARLSQLHPRKRGRRGRKPPASRKLRKRFLIVCEGEVTEVEYFEAFPVNRREVLVAVEGEGKNTTSLVAAAIEHANRAVHDRDPFDEVWVVYDHDDFLDERFNQAQDAIRALDGDTERPERWFAAWSNEAFEVWYLLHFQFFDSELQRHVVQEKVGEQLRQHGMRPTGYRKNDPGLYQLLLPRQADAIKHAKTLEQRRGAATPSEANPCTLVHHLVEALNAEIP